MKLQWKYVGEAEYAIQEDNGHIVFGGSLTEPLYEIIIK